MWREEVLEGPPPVSAIASAVRRRANCRARSPRSDGRARRSNLTAGTESHIRSVSRVDHAGGRPGQPVDGQTETVDAAGRLGRSRSGTAFGRLDAGRGQAVG